jgi:hypothetical protein
VVRSIAILVEQCLTNQKVFHTFRYMPRHVRHDRQKSRTFSGEQDAITILNVLNLSYRDDEYARSREASDAKDRVLSVIKQISRLLDRIVQTDGWPMNFEEMPRHLTESFVTLNKTLRRYTATPMLIPLKSEPRGWDVVACRFEHLSVAEFAAVHDLVRLAKQNRFRQLKLCDCGKWYFARFSHQRFCSEKCRIQFWENSEDRKSQKRAKAREYYEFHKIRQRR